jgi:hypothetical protein
MTALKHFKEYAMEFPTSACSCFLLRSIICCKTQETELTNTIPFMSAGNIVNRVGRREAAANERKRFQQRQLPYVIPLF